MAVSTANPTPSTGFHLNSAPAGFDPRREFPEGFLNFLAPLHRRFTPWQQRLISERKEALRAAHNGQLPHHLQTSDATKSEWHIELPEWCRDQRNQMTGPADEAELVVKMLNSGAPGVMLDLEDSTVNQWDHQQLGLENTLAALGGELTYHDKKRDREVGINPSSTVIWIRVRGLHLNQAGVANGDLMSASLFDLAQLVYRINPDELKHPLAIYIPKSESAGEALWWSDLFKAVAEMRGWPTNYIKCMALVESHPLAYQMEEFLYNLRDHILGLNLGRWDYMASLIHFNLEDPRWVLPDRNTIPHDVPFFQNLRNLLPELCHKHGAMAIGGMTALYPSREDSELNERALTILAKDKKNEANSLMDGAWTGHPDQNQIAVDQFPFPNQVDKRLEHAERYPDLRPIPDNVGKRTLAGTRAAVRTVIRYRNGVLNGKGASLLDGYMEDLATDRIYRLMLAQRLRHSGSTPIVDEESGQAVQHTPELLTRLFDEELEKLIANPGKDLGTAETFRQARRIGEAMVRNNEFDPF
jgi:malate synthase